eukprot:1218339-Prymnesium_polylepis.2
MVKVDFGQSGMVGESAILELDEVEGHKRIQQRIQSLCRDIQILIELIEAGARRMLQIVEQPKLERRGDGGERVQILKCVPHQGVGIAPVDCVELRLGCVQLRPGRRELGLDRSELVLRRQEFGVGGCKGCWAR